MFSILVFAIVDDTKNQSLGMLLFVIVLLRHRTALSGLSNQETADLRATKCLGALGLIGSESISRPSLWWNLTIWTTLVTTNKLVHSKDQILVGASTCYWSSAYFLVVVTRKAVYSRICFADQSKVGASMKISSVINRCRREISKLVLIR